MKFSLPQARRTGSILLCTTLALTLSGCLGRPQVNVTTRLIDCPRIVPDTLRAGPEATQAPAPDATAGGWINFAQLTEAGRLSENRDKRTIDQLYRNCAAENERINQPVRRRRFLGLF